MPPLRLAAIGLVLVLVEIRLGSLLLSLDLMSAFFLRDFLAAFAERVDASGDWIVALQRLAMDGLRELGFDALEVSSSSTSQRESEIEREFVDAARNAARSEGRTRPKSSDSSRALPPARLRSARCWS